MPVTISSIESTRNFSVIPKAELTPQIEKSSIRRVLSFCWMGTAWQWNVAPNLERFFSKPTLFDFLHRLLPCNLVDVLPLRWFQRGNNRHVQTSGHSCELLEETVRDFTCFWNTVDCSAQPVSGNLDKSHQQSCNPILEAYQYLFPQ